VSGTRPRRAASPVSQTPVGVYRIFLHNRIPNIPGSAFRQRPCIPVPANPSRISTPAHEKYRQPVPTGHMAPRYRCSPRHTNHLLYGSCSYTLVETALSDSLEATMYPPCHNYRSHALAEVPLSTQWHCETHRQRTAPCNLLLAAASTSTTWRCKVLKGNAISMRNPAGCAR
jgi:hypothetical protein